MHVACMHMYVQMDQRHQCLFAHAHYSRLPVGCCHSSCELSALRSRRHIFTVKNDSLSLRLRANQLRTTTLGKIFNVFPQSLFLVGSDSTVATPDKDGDFESFDMSQDIKWFVVIPPKHYSLEMPAVSTTSYAYQSQQSEACTSKSVKSAKWKPSLSLSLMRNKPPGVKQGQSKEKWKRSWQSMDKNY